MKFTSYGVHTRLQYLINRVGGIDVAIRRKWFEDKYGFDKETIDLVLMYDIEYLLTKNTIDEIKQSVEQINRNNGLKKLQHEKKLKCMLTTLCCMRNMLRPGKSQ